MGLTISYRGSLGDLDRVEDFEDRVLDLALELGGEARIWRSADDGVKKGTVPICPNGLEGASHLRGQSPFSHDNPSRMVRGVMLNLFPGQETTSLLISPEGWLINLTEIEEAEKGQLTEPSWCFVKTQFGPIEGHVALVELLAVLKQEFFPNLEVHDEGDYWESRDLADLTAKFNFLKKAIEQFADGLNRYGLTDEAAEDQEILISRIERIAQVVHRTLSRPAEHPPVRWNDGETSFGDDAEVDESQWDASFKENRRRQEHIHRAIEEHLANGDDLDEAFDAAMLEETALGLPEEPATLESSDNDWEEKLANEDDEDEEDESWRESLPKEICEEDEEDEEEEDGDIDDLPHHPLQQRVFDLMLRLHKLFNSKTEENAENKETEAAGSHRDVLLQGAGEMLGGLAQALGSNDLHPLSGLSKVQLKRALRGAAFALGALFPLRSAGAIDRATFDELHDTIESLQTDIFAELTRLRQQDPDET